MVNRLNKDLELLRFLASLLILAHHSYIFGFRHHFIEAWVLVEVFFMWSAYFTTSHFLIIKNKDFTLSSIFSYILKKCRKLLPFAYLGIFFGFCLSIFTNKPLLTIISLPFNLTLLSGTPFINSFNLLNFNNPLWYISQLFFFLPFIIYLLIKWPKYYKYLSFLLPPFLYIYILKSCGTLCIWKQSSFLLIRSLTALLLGSNIYFICLYLNKYYEKYYFFQKLIDIFKYLSWLLLLYLIIFASDLHLYHSLEIIILAYFCNILLLLSKSTLFVNIDNNIVRFIGTLSLPVYCLHFPLMQIVQIIFFILTFKLKLILSTSLTLLSAYYFIKRYTYKHLS